MPDAPDPPPPGWYADPGHQHGSRWWDGARWTDHVRRLPPGDDPPPPPVVPGTPATGATRSRTMARTMVALLVAGLVGTVVVATTVAGRRAPGPGVLDPAQVQQRGAAAGCTTVVDGEPLDDRRHLDPADAPPADVLYPDRPAHSGRHFADLLPAPDGLAAAPIDERAVLHNLEHGSVVVWLDPAALDVRTPEAVGQWRDERADLGFRSRSGGAVFASPMPRDLDDPPPVALRAWGVAVDCERFDPVVADAFLAQHWGSHGQAPEADLSPYPDGVLRFAERA